MNFESDNSIGDNLYSNNNVECNFRKEDRQEDNSFDDDNGSKFTDHFVVIKRPISVNNSSQSVQEKPKNPARLEELERNCTSTNSDKIKKNIFAESLPSPNKNPSNFSVNGFKKLNDGEDNKLTSKTKSAFSQSLSGRSVGVFKDSWQVKTNDDKKDDNNKKTGELITSQQKQQISDSFSKWKNLEKLSNGIIPLPSSPQNTCLSQQERKYSVGKPNVWKSSGTIPMLPVRMMKNLNVSSDNENDEYEYDQNKSIRSNPDYSQGSESPEILSKDFERLELKTETALRPATAPQASVANEISVDSDTANNSTAPESKIIMRTLGSSTISNNTKGIYPFFNTRPLTAGAERTRIAPIIDINGKINLKSTVGDNIFCRNPIAKLSGSKIPSSPMDQNFPLITKFMIKSNNQPLSQPATPKQTVLHLCGQKSPVPMDLIFKGLTNIKKVGEGVFGEVFMGNFYLNENMRVYKIVPIEGKELVNGEIQKSYEKIYPEIFNSKQLNRLHDGHRKCFTDGYVKLHNILITIGTYPDVLVESWKMWNKEHESDNDCPNTFTKDQLYVVFECEHGGEDLESFKFENAKDAFFLALQVAHILAVGEVAFEFEHRDLHWGNILVQRTPSRNITYHLDGITKSVQSFGLKAHIIDFTMARGVNDSNEPVFLDMKEDEEQFLGTGDHQFDIYRVMKDYNRNEWNWFCPKTNIFWIHYLADKLLNSGRYKETESETHFTYLKKLHQLKNEILDLESCKEFVFSTKCDDYKKNV